MAVRARLLLDFVYYNPVGHTVEALKYARGFAAANPGVEVHLTHRADAPCELADGCDWVSGVYPVELRDFEAASIEVPASLERVPRSWDWVVENNLIEVETRDPGALGRDGDASGGEEQAMLRYLDAARGWFRPERGRGTLYPSLRLPSGLNYRAGTPIRIRVPVSVSGGAAAGAGGGLRVCVLLGGSAGQSHYPSVQSWAKILRAVEDAYPGASIFLTGVTRPVEGRTSSGYTREEIETVAASLRQASLVYDVGIWSQLALVESCDVFVSPHTGFAFLAPSVGTPWVAISGGDWPEWFFNDVPFYSVLPDNPDYPYEGRLDKYRQHGKIPCMEQARLEARIPEIVEAVGLVTDPAFTYQAALERHGKNIARANVRRDRIPTGPTF